MKSPISNNTMNLLFEQQVLNKYSVKYYQCPESLIIQTEEPYWLDESYSTAIADTDTGILARNLENSDMVCLISSMLGKAMSNHSDIAGGYGILTRLLRDKGVSCFTSDKYCSNLFAKQFEAEQIEKADVLLAFEVMEHISDPVMFLSDAIKKFQSSVIIFSTLTYKGEQPPKDWWYYSFETGQHISFYHEKSLRDIAEQLGLHYFSISSGLHIFTEKKISKWQKKCLTHKKLRKYLTQKSIKALKSKSKTWADFNQAKDALLK